MPETIASSAEHITTQIATNPLMHPMWSPIAIKLGPLAIHWYGLMYLLGFILFLVLGRQLIKRPAYQPYHWTTTDLDDMLFYGVIGVILGGRLGYILFYKFDQYLTHPLDMLKIWQGGMSFHGGLIGVIVAMIVFAKVKKHSFWAVADMVAPLVPTGLMTGRIGNFINGELWGRPVQSDVPWAMIFPQAGDSLARHPSQLYQSLGEGFLLFVLLWAFMGKPRPTGACSGLFLVGYGTFRFIAEYFREPDRYLAVQALDLSRGQWLCVPMIISGIMIMVWAYKRPTRYLL